MHVKLITIVCTYNCKKSKKITVFPLLDSLFFVSNFVFLLDQAVILCQKFGEGVVDGKALLSNPDNLQHAQVLELIQDQTGVV